MFGVFSENHVSAARSELIQANCLCPEWGLRKLPQDIALNGSPGTMLENGYEEYDEIFLERAIQLFL